jgi:hypothetical protein
MKIFSNFRNPDSPVYDDLKKLDKPITFFYDYPPQSLEELQINPYNFLMIHEPDEFFGIHSWVAKNHHLYSGILTWNEDLLENCPNTMLFTHNAEGIAGSVSDEFLDEFTQKYTKQFEVSFLSGAKSLVEGHKLRQEIYKIKDQINIPKKWYYVLEDFNQKDFDNGGAGRPDEIWIGKQICYDTPMFHIAVENVNHNNWYTEKITDAFATKTIPIYWGCPNIGEFYDERGIIRFNTISELIEIVNNLTPELYYEMKPYIENNYQIVKADRLKDKLNLFFNQIIELNNL